jgi:hypothetical protein
VFTVRTVRAVIGRKPARETAVFVSGTVGTERARWRRAERLNDLVSDKQGNLYGVTAGGGICLLPHYESYPCGTVFELSPPANTGGAWTETVLYKFGTDLADGSNPVGNLVRDKHRAISNASNSEKRGVHDHHWKTARTGTDRDETLRRHHCRNEPPQVPEHSVLRPVIVQFREVRTHGNRHSDSINGLSE